MIEYKEQLNKPEMVEHDEAYERTEWMSKGIIENEKR